LGVVGSDLRLARRVLDLALGAGHEAVLLTGNLTTVRPPGID
jgi:hypothetical protein